MKKSYQIIGLIFFVWVFFLSDHDLFFMWANCRKKKALIIREKVLEQKIAAIKDTLFWLEEDADFLEKYARERYGFKSKQEIIYKQEDGE